MVKAVNEVDCGGKSPKATSALSNTEVDKKGSGLRCSLSISERKSTRPIHIAVDCKSLP